MASRLCVRVVLLALCAGLFCASSPVIPAQTAQQKTAFSVRDASALLRQITDGLITRRAGKILDAFDLGRMRDGALFRQQIVSFLSHTDSVRVHFNVTKAAMDGEKGTATVDAEVEADSPDGNTPPLHKQATLRFIAEHTGAGWKFTNMEPRSFLSTSTSPAAASASASPSQ